MSAHHHPNWLKEARRAEGGAVADDDGQMSQHHQEMMKQVKDFTPGSHAMDNAMKPSSHYEDMINRANESGADPADVQDVLQGAMHRAHGGRTRRRADGGSIGPETVDDGDTSPMAVEEKGRSIPMSQKNSQQQGGLSQSGLGTDAFNQALAGTMGGSSTTKKGD